jgi:hypothetical protein
VKNFVKVSIGAPVAIGASSITVADAEPPFVSPDPAGGTLTLVDDLGAPTQFEIITYTGYSAGQLTGVTKGAEGTTDQEWPEGAVAIAAPTAGVLELPREWSASTVSQSEAEAGVATARRAWTAERVRQAIDAVISAVGNATQTVSGWMSPTDKTKLDGVATGATANSSDAQLRDRATHTGTQPLSTISDAGTAAAADVEAFATAAQGLKADTALQPGASPTVLSVDPLRRSVESASGGRMTVLYTANGQPCYMHVLPKFMLEDVDPTLALGTGVHPAFIKGGTELTELFIGAYQAKVVGGEALSQPMQDPTTYVNYDQAKAYCAANGSGWHLMTNWEWAAIALWCMANGYEPLGNTNYGRHYDQRYQTGRRQDGGQPGNTSGTARTLTGSGPADWAHDKTPAGIHDLVGNVWEWQGGLKLQDGRVVMPADNDWDADESAWVAQDLWFSSGSATATTSALSLVTDAGSVVRNSGFYDYRSPWSALPITGTAPLSTQQALLAPAGIAPVGLAYARTYGERLPIRGGGWYNAGNAGLAALHLNAARTYAYSGIGFRPAFGL